MADLVTTQQNLVGTYIAGFCPNCQFTSQGLIPGTHCPVCGHLSDEREMPIYGAGITAAPQIIPPRKTS